MYGTSCQFQCEVYIRAENVHIIPKYYNYTRVSSAIQQRFSFGVA